MDSTKTTQFYSLLMRIINRLGRHTSLPKKHPAVQSIFRPPLFVQIMHVSEYQSPEPAKPPVLPFSKPRKNALTYFIPIPHIY